MKTLDRKNLDVTNKIRSNIFDWRRQFSEEIEWERDMNRFYGFFTDLAIKHYQRVGRDAQSRIQAIEAFKKGGYAKFQFK